MVTVLVDTSHLLYRSHHTFNKFSTSSGMSTGVHFGVMRTIEHIHKSYPGCVIIFALDGHPVGRKELYPLYKANRTGQPQSHGDIIHDFGVTVDIKELVKACGCAVAQHTQFESDDLIAMLATNATIHIPFADKVIIYSGDDDFCQLAAPWVDIWKPPAGKTHPERIVTEKDVLKEWGVEAKSLALLRSFMGDSGDNIPGIPRCPRARLIPSVQGKSTPAHFYDGDGLAYFNPEWKAKLASFRAQCEINFRLCRLPWEQLPTVPLDFDKCGLSLSNLETIFQKLEFTSYLRKLGEVGELLKGKSYVEAVLTQPVRSQPGENPS
jgi:hypothetical protein